MIEEVMSKFAPANFGDEFVAITRGEAVLVLRVFGRVIDLARRYFAMPDMG
jgi:hypothetical protein